MHKGRGYGHAPGMPLVFILLMIHTGLERVRLGPPLMSFSLVGAAIGRDFHHETRWHISGDETEPLDERAPPSMRRSMCWIRRRGVFTLLKPGCECGDQAREMDHATTGGSRIDLPLAPRACRVDLPLAPRACRVDLPLALRACMSRAA